MKSKVYFVRVKEKEDIPGIREKFSRLISQNNLLDFVRPGQQAVIKMHFGEEGNTGFVKPQWISVACDKLKEKGAACLVSDTNTLYKGKRTNSKDHLVLAQEHGFTEDALGAQVVIPDDNQEENIARVPINQKFIKEAQVVKLFLEADILIDIAHFKGHIMTGFGAALKNIGMGCATRKGKLTQHSDVSPVVYADKCTGCAACEKACPAAAITIVNKKACIDNTQCIGCASCIAACPVAAIDINWDSGEDTIQQKMIEYALAVLDKKKGRSAFFNFLLKITQECDCLAKDDPRIAPDIGILASTDPVAIDKAGLDLVKKAAGKDVFKETHPNRNGLIQLEYAQELGLGSLEYELLEVS